MLSKKLIGEVSSRETCRKILVILDKLGVTSPSKLASLLNVPRCTVSLAIKFLEEKKLVKDLTPEKKSWKSITITDKGRKIAKTIKTPLDDEILNNNNRKETNQENKEIILNEKDLERIADLIVRHITKTGSIIPVGSQTEPVTRRRRTIIKKDEKTIERTNLYAETLKELKELFKKKGIFSETRSKHSMQT